MISMGFGLTFILLNTAMLVANATVTTIGSFVILKEVRKRDKKD